MNIKAKIITVIALTIILTVGISTAVLLKQQNSLLLKSKLEDAEFLCNIVERTTESAMKEGNATEVQRIIENVGKNSEILNLRILSPNGTILKSKNRLEIGAKAPDYLKSSIDGSSVQPTFINDTTINHFHVINNREECYGCHDSSNRVIGYIQVKHDVSRNMATFLSIKKLVVFSNVAVVTIVSIVLSLLFSRLVMNPLGNLLTTIKCVEDGDLEATADVRGKDELSVIGSSFNKMICRINNMYRQELTKERELSKVKVELEHKNRVEALNSQLAFKIKELETANKAIMSLSKEVKGKNIQLEKAVDKLKKIGEIGRMLSSIVDTQELMRIIIQTTAETLGSDTVTMHLRNSHSAPVTIQYKQGIGIETISDLSAELGKEYADLFAHGKPFFSGNNNSPADGAKPASGPKLGVPLKIKGHVTGAMIVQNLPESSPFNEDALQLLTTLSNHAVVAMENAWLYESLKSSYLSTIQSLVNALEASDRFTKGHSERVRLLSVELGKHIGLDAREIELIEQASILHDIGKIGIDQFVIQKQGKLTAKEYSMIKAHPLIGDEILNPIENLEEVRKTIIQHHERYDGKGYPYGLQGDELSLKSKILSVADTFDAMMTDRPYRKALSIYRVKEELKTNAGTQFDPYVVEAFIDMLDIKGDDILSTAGYNTLYSAI